MDIRVKCACVLNLNSSQKILSLVAENPVFIHDLQNEAQVLYQTLLSQQSNPSLQSSPVQKIYSHSGAWYSTIKNGICLSLLVSSAYPMPSAMRLLRAIEDLLRKEINGRQDFVPKEPQIRDLLTAYDKDPYTDDRVEITCKSVDSVQGLMEENLKKIHNNHTQLEVIHHKSADVTLTAQQFSKGAKDINAKMAWQQYLLYGVIAAILCGVIIYFVI